jgi:hypothetical protein
VKKARRDGWIGHRIALAAVVEIVPHVIDGHRPRPRARGTMSMLREPVRRVQPPASAAAPWAVRVLKLTAKHCQFIRE